MEIIEARKKEQEPVVESRQARGPRWWAVYLMFLVILGLFWLEVRSHFTPGEHEAAQFGLALLFCGAVATWLYRQRVALVHQAAHDVAGCSYRLMTPGEDFAVYEAGCEAAQEECDEESVYSQLFNQPVIVAK